VAIWDNVAMLEILPARGIAAALSYMRYLNGAHINNSAIGVEATVFIPWLDLKSPFANLNAKGYGVNTLVLYAIFTLNMFAAPIDMLTKSITKLSTPDEIFNLQWPGFPFLITNAAIPSSNTWREYTKAVYLDKLTGLAVMHISTVRQDHGVSQNQTESAKVMLDYIANTNFNHGCNSTNNYTMRNVLVDWQVYTPPPDPVCYLPAIFFADDDQPETFVPFLEAILSYVNPPAIIIDINGAMPEYNKPTKVGHTWVMSYIMRPEVYHHQKITLSSDKFLPQILNVSLLEFDMYHLPTAVEDSIYNFTVDVLSWLSNFTMQDSNPAANANTNGFYSSPNIKLKANATLGNVNASIGVTSAFPPVVDLAGTYRRCYAGECEIGNFFADAIRFFANTTVAFLSSQMFEGHGWPAGKITESEIWEAVPFANNVCNGTMTGLSLFKVINYSIGESKFKGVETAKTGELLLQISGMKVTYNSELTGNRIVAFDVWNNATGTYQPLDRLQLYTFATNIVCDTIDMFSQMVGPALVAPGEQPGAIQFDLVQSSVGVYLNELSSQGVVYHASLEGRLKTRHVECQCIANYTTPGRLYSTNNLLGSGRLGLSQVSVVYKCVVLT
jgi:hypothetical protein